MDEINRQVSQRLRQLRTAAGLSLEALARRSGVSRATLSQIESLKTNPTIAVLWRIAGGLEVPFAELIGADPNPLVRVSRAADASYLFSADRGFRSRPLLSHVPGHRVELYELRLEPGSVERASPHAPGSFEQIFVTTGALLLSAGVADERYELETGDAIFFPADQPHTYENPGTAAFEGLSLILYPS